MHAPFPRVSPAVPALALLVAGSLPGAASLEPLPAPSSASLHAPVPEPSLFHIAASVIGIVLLLRRRS